MSFRKYQTLVLVLGDVVLLWVGLWFTLFLRYFPGKLEGVLDQHLLPFSIVFSIWIVILYIVGLYDIRAISDPTEMFKKIASVTIVQGGVAIALFYFISAFQITPRTNLLIDLVITVLLLSSWRFFFANAMKQSAKTRLLLLGTSPDLEELASAINRYPQLGYLIAARVLDVNADIVSFIKEKSIDIVVAPREIHANAAFVQSIYGALHQGIRFVDASLFYERVMGKIPVSLISKIWFLENIAETEKTFFEIAKRVFDFVFALILALLTLPIIILAALWIKLDSTGPLLLRQKRVGKLGKIYTHYKLRTMIALGPDGHAEPNGVVWSAVNDTRITRSGRWLRALRIDELPQLWNVIRGELSFIGPRPERPEFVERLKKDIPYYDMRHLVRPGLSGWAQINPPFYYASMEETLIKLQYDLFYIKNRNIGLDIDIALKTLMVIASQQGR